MRCPHLDIRKLDKIFITHLHGDHVFGLAGMLAYASAAMGGRRGRKKTVAIYGPPGVRAMVRVALNAVPQTFNVRVAIHEMLTPDLHKTHIEVDESPHDTEVDARDMLCDASFTWTVFKDSSVEVKAAPLRHKVRCIGYVIAEKRGPVITGPKVVILGDTCDSRAIADAGLDADVLIHEATFDNAQEDKAVQYGHSSAGMAGSFARRLQAKRLILTHFSSRFESNGSYTSQGAGMDDRAAVQQLVREAQRAFGSANVIAAKDLLRIPVSSHPR